MTLKVREIAADKEGDRKFNVSDGTATFTVATLRTFHMSGLQCSCHMASCDHKTAVREAMADVTDKPLEEETADAS